MKTTVDIPEKVLQQARKLAASSNITLKTLIEMALRDKIAQAQKPQKDFELKIPTVKGNGLQAGLSFDNWSEIRELSYDDEAPK